MYGFSGKEYIDILQYLLLQYNTIRLIKILDRCSTSGGEPEDLCMIVVYVAEAGSEGFHNQ